MWRVAGSIDNSLDMLRVCGYPITRLTNLSLDHLLLPNMGGQFEITWSSMMHYGQKQCSVGKSHISGHFYDSVESVAD